MKYTANYSLKKPDGTDIYNVQNDNDNMDEIDTQLKTTANSLAGHTEDKTNPHGVTTKQVNLIAEIPESATGTSYPNGVSLFTPATGWSGPIGMSLNGQVMTVCSLTDLRVSQYYFAATVTSPYIYYRNWYNGVWSAWRKLLDSSNGIQGDGSLLQRGSQSISLSAANHLGANITFPKAFSATPNIVLGVTSANGVNLIATYNNATSTGCQLVLAYDDTGTTTVSGTVEWVAVGPA